MLKRQFLTCTVNGATSSVNLKQDLGSGCGAVDRVVASNNREPGFESILNKEFLTVNCQEKRVRNAL